MSPGAQFPIRIAEELILLMLDERSGYLEMVPGWDFSCVMAGAVLADLALERRIETDLERLYLVVTVRSWVYEGQLYRLRMAFQFRRRGLSQMSFLGLS